MKLSIKTLVAVAFSGLISSAFAAESLTVADLHAKRVELGGQQVSITGKVIKVNQGVMRRNFIHVQDDTAAGEVDRVIFTSQQVAEVGSQITATGTVKLDTDFGMGYFYPTLVEEATFTAAQ
ncbi:MAG: hypothetical protein V7629_15135 [Motiliproteus sp.]